MQRHTMNAKNALLRGDAMAMLTVRNLPDDVHRALRVQAALHGHSTEAEVREILANGVIGDRPQLFRDTAPYDATGVSVINPWEA